jgi:hypothetical protein
MPKIFQTTIFYRLFCFIIAGIVLFLIFSYLRTTNSGSLFIVIFLLGLFAIFFYHAFYFESFIINENFFIYSKVFMIFNIKQNKISYASIVNIEKIQNVQLFVKFIINYNDDSGTLSQFRLMKNNLFFSRFMNPNIDLVIEELSSTSGIKIVNKFE